MIYDDDEPYTKYINIYSKINQNNFNRHIIIKCLSSFIIRELQINIMIRHCLIPVRMDISKILRSNVIGGI